MSCANVYVNLIEEIEQNIAEIEFKVYAYRGDLFDAGWRQDLEGVKMEENRQDATK